jgi:hypothetical protein
MFLVHSHFLSSYAKILAQGQFFPTTVRKPFTSIHVECVTLDLRVEINVGLHVMSVIFVRFKK